MHWSNQHDRERLNRPETNPQRQDAALLEAALTLAVCYAFASLGPRELLLATFSSLLFFAGWVSAAFAMLRGEPLRVNRFAGWDAAALFLALSIVLSWLVDVEAVRAYLEMRAQTGGMGAG